MRATHAVRRIGRLRPLRVACWEEAIATTLALRWVGHSVTFRHGVATGPVRLHAWIEVGGRPVAESADITDYTPFEELDERNEPAGPVGPSRPHRPGGGARRPGPR